MTGLAETPTAIRTRRMHDRRRRGYRCVRVEVSDQDAAALVAAGLLDPARAGDPSAVEAAVGLALDQLAQRVVARR